MQAGHGEIKSADRLHLIRCESNIEHQTGSKHHALQQAVHQHDPEREEHRRRSRHHQAQQHLRDHDFDYALTAFVRLGI